MKALSSFAADNLRSRRIATQRRARSVAPWWRPPECLRQTSQGRETTAKLMIPELAQQQLANGGGFDVLKAAGKLQWHGGVLEV
jgi:hypothetical protein